MQSDPPQNLLKMWLAYSVLKDSLHGANLSHQAKGWIRIM